MLIMVQPKDIEHLDHTIHHEKSLNMTVLSTAKRNTPEYRENFEKQEDIFYLEKVIDWERRIAGYSDVRKEQYHKAFEKMQEALTLVNEDSKTNGWKTGYCNKKRGMSSETKIENG